MVVEALILDRPPDPERIPRRGVQPAFVVDAQHRQVLHEEVVRAQGRKVRRWRRARGCHRSAGQGTTDEQVGNPLGVASADEPVDGAHLLALEE